MATISTLIIRQLGIQDYQETWQQMQQFTDNRTEDTPNEIWSGSQHAGCRK